MRALHHKDVLSTDVYSIQLKPSLSPIYVTTVTAFDNDQAGTPNSNVTYTIYGSTVLVMV